MKSSARSTGCWQSDIVAMGLTALWLVIARAALEVPWGFGIDPATGDILPGISFNAGDTWSYLSWAIQYADGSGAAELIYTTEPHPGLLWIFPLWLIGWVANLTGFPALLVYNVSGVAGTVAAVFAFRRVTRLLVPSASACDWATTIFVMGSGSSWIWHILHESAGLSAVPGGEFHYLDFLPATTFLAYPYHALSCALLACLWWSVTAFEQRMIAGQAVRGQFVAIMGCAALLSFSRPYEPLAFSAAYGLKTVLAWKHRHTSPEVWISSRNAAAILGFAVIPGVLWTGYVAVQPIWSTFAKISLALGLPRTGWLTAFGALWLTAAVASPRLIRHPHLRGLLPLCATLLSIVFLLGLGNSGVKLSSGLPLGIAIAAGVGLTELMGIIHRRVRFSGLRGIAGTIVTILVLGTPSLSMNLLAMRLNPPFPIDAELAEIVGKIPVRTNGKRSVVMTDTATGLILPGWRGLRVYAGHFSLTHDFASKQATIRSSGLDPQHLPESPDKIRTHLSALLLSADPDYVLIDANCVEATTMLASLSWVVRAENQKWSLWQPVRE